MARRIRERARPALLAVVATLLAATFTTAASAGAAALPQLSVRDTAWGEEAPGCSCFPVYVELSNTTTSTVTVDYITVDDTAFAATDYSAAHGTLTIPPGATEASIELNIFQDDVVEGYEYFFVEIFNPVNATIADGRATVGVGNAQTDTDPPPASVGIAQVREGNSGDTVAAFVIRLGARSSVERTVTVQTRELEDQGLPAATEGVDYDPVTTVLKFPPGVLTKRFLVNVNGDTVDEADEWFEAAIVFAYSDISSEESHGAEIGIIYDDDQPSSK